MEDEEEEEEEGRSPIQNGGSYFNKIELCTHPILVQKEQIELTRSFYTHLYIILLTLAKIQIMVTTTTLCLSLRASFKFCMHSEQKGR